MSPRLAGVFLGLVTASLFTVAAAPARAAKPRIAIIGLSMGDVTAEVRIKMNAAIVGGLIASGAEVADSTATGRLMAERGMVACDTATCLTEIGRAAGAAYVMRGSMEMTGRSYNIRREMIDGSTASVIDTREDRCEICTETEAYETASVSASALKSQVFRRRLGPQRVPAPAAAAASPPLSKSAATATSSSSSFSPLEPARGYAEPMLIDAPAPPDAATNAAEPPSSSHALAWTSGGLSLAAIAAGVTLIALDGGGCGSTMGTPSSPTCSPHNTMTGGLVLSAVGLAAAAASVLAFTGHF